MTGVVELRLERERLAPGEWLRGWVLVHRPSPARELSVWVRLMERTQDYEEEALSGWTGPLHRGPLPPGTAFPWQLQIPPYAPPPYRSRWGELYWEADAKVDMEGGRDSHDRRRILIVPPHVQEAALAGPGAAATTPVAGAEPPSTPSANSPSGSFPPGWYPDPWLEKRLRHWDGNVWTHATAD